MAKKKANKKAKKDLAQALEPEVEAFNEGPGLTSDYDSTDESLNEGITEDATLLDPDLTKGPGPSLKGLKTTGDLRHSETVAGKYRKFLT